MKNYSKYKNKKIKVDGYNFDSKKEAHYYLQYKILARAGKIKDLKLQPSFELQNKFRDKDGVSHRAIIYKGDFSFIENDKKVVVDVKPSSKFKTDVYRIKKKLLMFKYPDINFREVY